MGGGIQEEGEGNNGRGGGGGEQEKWMRWKARELSISTHTISLR